NSLLFIFCDRNLRVLLIQQRYCVGWRCFGARLQKEIDVSKLSIGDGLRCVGWHLACGLANVRKEPRIRDLWRPDSRSASLNRTLSLIPVALVAAERYIKTLAILGVRRRWQDDVPAHIHGMKKCVHIG